MVKDDFVVQDINLDGFTVVRSNLFSRILEPCMTMWESSIAFNVPAYNSLNNCEAVQIMVNVQNKSILVKPTPSREADAINWIRDPTRPKTTKLECTLFTRNLFDVWGWNREQRYRTSGKLVRYGKNLMLLFDFNNPLVYKGMKKVKDDG